MYLRAEGTLKADLYSKIGEVALSQDKHQKYVDLLKILRDLLGFLILSHSAILEKPLPIVSQITQFSG